MNLLKADDASEVKLNAIKVNTMAGICLNAIKVCFIRLLFPHLSFNTAYMPKFLILTASHELIDVNVMLK